MTTLEAERTENGNVPTGMMRKMNRKGDGSVFWNKNDPKDVALAERFFKAAKKEGMAAYRVEGEDGKRGEVIREFDPEAERIIFVPQLRGGC
jgi:hypothetical protein